MPLSAGGSEIRPYGVVFPAIKSDAELAEQVMSKKGVDVSAFLTEATAPNGTFLFPIADHAADVLRVTKVGIDSILLNGADPAATFKKVNSEVNGLFE
jgi:multiple sugar transport system substrate-binding protein